MLEISLIQPYSKNAKKHPKKQVEQIAASIKEFGFNQPIVIDKDNIVIVGHGRLEAAKLLGMTEVPILRVDRLTDEQVSAYRLADNRLNESGWDMDLVVEELKGLTPYLIEISGFSKDLIIEGNEKDDEIPAVPSEPRSKLGDLYEIGGHRVVCGDATLLDTVLLATGGQKVDLFLTDPPYNVDYVGKTKDALKIENDSMNDSGFRNFLTNAFKVADEVMKPGAVFYIWHADSEGYNFRGACHDIGWQVRQCLIWHKNTMVMGRQDYHWQHEPCLYGWKDGSAHLWNSDRTQTTILNFDRPTKSESHPTMKPVELIAYQLTNNTKEQDIVLDTFLGSGTTLIAAEKTGRYCFGTELDPKYVDVIIQRWVDYTGINEITKNGESYIWNTKS